MHLRLPSSRLGCLLLTYALKTGHADRNCTCVKSLCRRPPVTARPRRDAGVTGWACTSYSGVTARGLSTSPSATELVPSAGLAPAWSCGDRFVLSQVCLLIPPRGHRNGVNRIGIEPDLSRLKGAGAPPATQRNVAIVRRLALRKPGLRGLLLEPLCIHDHTWWSASESHRSGYLLARQIRVPSPHPINSELLTATTRSIRIRWPRLSTTSRLVPSGGLEPPSRRLRGGTLAR